ncbi:MAG: TolC family protein [Bacteroides sp.]
MKTIYILLLCTWLPLAGWAQVKQTVSLTDYLKEVSAKNLAFAAEKLNLSIAEANVRAAKVFNDPTLSVEYANNDDHRIQMGQGYSVGLSRTFAPGKRGAGIRLARSEKELTAALLDDYFRTLRAEAVTAYMEAIKQRKLYEVKLSSYQSILELAKADSIKFALGKITEVDALQSRVEAGVSHNELMQAESELARSYAALYIPLGTFNADTLFVPAGGLDLTPRTRPLTEWLEQALDNRADLVAALKNVDVAQRALQLARRERLPEFDLALGYNYNTEVRNELAPAPSFSGVTMGISFPLKFSALNRGAVRSARYKQEQAEQLAQQAALEVQTEVVQNHQTYLSLCAQVARFKAGLLDKAEAVLTGKIYSYNRGETSLLEVLNAQRTYNEVQTLYIETQFDHTASLVALEKSAGLWDVEQKE